MFSKSCTYAIRAVIYLASQNNEDSKTGVVEIAEELNIPKHFLAKTLQHLSKHQLISSVKGPKGGFYLGKVNADVTLQDIIECIDGDSFFNNCVLGLPECSDDCPCPMHEHVSAFRENMQESLKFKKITDLARVMEIENLKI
jgi:Rrf2 family protein